MEITRNGIDTAGGPPTGSPASSSSTRSPRRRSTADGAAPASTTDESGFRPESQLVQPSKEAEVSTIASTIGKFVWHEQVSSDPKQAQEFYSQLFGWDAHVFKPGEADYTM